MGEYFFSETRWHTEVIESGVKYKIIAREQNKNKDEVDLKFISSVHSVCVDDSFR